MKHRILILEDDPDMREALVYALSEYDCLACTTLRQAMQELQFRWDLILLDLGLPDGNGLDFLEAIRLESDIPVLVLSGTREEQTMLETYEKRGDDYITKPVRLPVLKAKIDRLLEKKDRLRQGTVMLDTMNHILHAGGTILLTTTETAILEPLFHAEGKSASMETIIRSVWSRTGREISPSTLSVRISGIRKKLKQTDLKIEGSRSHGYKLAFEKNETVL